MFRSLPYTMTVSRSIAIFAAALSAMLFVIGCDKKDGPHTRNLTVTAASAAKRITSGKSSESPDPKCGPRSLWVAAGLLGVSKDLDELCILCKMDDKGTTLLDLKNAAETLGFQARGVKCTWEDLIGFDSPVILFVYGDHFVCVDPRDKASSDRVDRIRVYNLPKPTILMGRDDLKSIWNGESLVIARKESASLVLSQSKSFPRASFKYTYADFGIVKEDSVLTHTYTLGNTGNAPLKIMGLKKSCGCAEMKTSRTEIPPSGTAEIALAFDLHGRHGDQMIQGAVKTNDPHTPLVMLSFRGFVEKPVLFAPNMFDFGEMVPGQTLSRTVIVTDRGDQTLQWRRGGKTSIQFLDKSNTRSGNDNMPQCTFNYSPITSIKQVYRTAWGSDPDRPYKFETDSNKLLSYRFEIKCTVPNNASSGIYQGELAIIGFRQYDDKDYPVIVPIHLKVVDDIMIMPQTISFGVMAAGTTRTRTLTITSRTRKDISVTDLSFHSAILSTTDKGDIEITPSGHIQNEGGGKTIVDVTLSIPNARPNILSPLKGHIILKVGQDIREIKWMAMPPT